MSRTMAALLALLASVSLVSVGEPSPRVVDLNEPGVLEALKSSNPVHYEKIRNILQDILNHSDTGVPRWMQTTFDARDVKYIPIVLTSHPPKRQLSFILDAIRYEAVIVLTNVRGDIVPAK
jgi:hypothetical protein